MRSLSGAAAALLVVAMAGCGHETSVPTAADGTDTHTTSASPSAEARPSDDSPGTGRPPPLTLHAPDGDIDLDPSTFCYSDVDSGVGMCADGVPPADPPETTADGSVTLSFPLDGWTFTASFRAPGRPGKCDRLVSVVADDQGDGTHLLPALGPAGTWIVDVSGNGPEGDMFTRFRWTTTTDSTTTPPATGVVNFLGPPSAGGDNRKPEGYGPDLRLSGLDTDPRNATAQLVLTDGRVSSAYPMRLSRDDTCPDDGQVFFRGDALDEPATLPDLGAPPWTVEVHLTLDGEAYVGTGLWPDDLNPPNSNELPVVWDPALPAYGG